MAAFLEKYLGMLKVGGVIVALLGVFFLGHHLGATEQELSNSKEENATLNQKLVSTAKYYTDYQAMVKERDDALAQYHATKAQNDQLIAEKQNANQSNTLQLISTLRNPTVGMYSGNADCGEAGSYPEVFGYTVAPTGPATGH